MRRGKPPLTLETPPPGRWTYLVTCPKPTAAVAKLETEHSERQRKSEQIFQPCSDYSAYASDCAFCIVHGIWPRCGLRQPKRQRKI